MLKFSLVWGYIVVEPTRQLEEQDFILTPLKSSSVTFITDDNFKYEELKDTYIGECGFRFVKSYEELVEEVKRVCPEFPNFQSAKNAESVVGLLKGLTCTNYIRVERKYNFQGCRTEQGKENVRERTRLEVRKQTALLNQGHFKNSKKFFDAFASNVNSINNNYQATLSAIKDVLLRNVPEFVRLNKETLQEQVTEKIAEVGYQASNLDLEIRELKEKRNKVEAELVILENDASKTLIETDNELSSNIKQELLKALEEDKSKPKRFENRFFR